eukprot:SAG11_NODE_174_length_13505_cov_9.126585_7_plen_106_part_00
MNALALIGLEGMHWLPPGLPAPLPLRPRHARSASASLAAARALAASRLSRRSAAESDAVRYLSEEQSHLEKARLLAKNHESPLPSVEVGHGARRALAEFEAAARE